MKARFFESDGRIFLGLAADQWSEFCRPVSATDRDDYPGAWAAFQAGKERAVTVTPAEPITVGDSGSVAGVKVSSPEVGQKKRGRPPKVKHDAANHSE